MVRNKKNKSAAHKFKDHRSSHGYYRKWEPHLNEWLIVTFRGANEIFGMTDTRDTVMEKVPYLEAFKLK